MLGEEGAEDSGGECPREQAGWGPSAGAPGEVGAAWRRHLLVGRVGNGGARGRRFRGRLGRKTGGPCWGERAGRGAWRTGVWG